MGLKITFAMLFIGVVLVAAELEGRNDGPDDANNDEKDIQVQRRNRTWRTFILCEGRSGTIRCPRGSHITVRYANYGRTTHRHVCSHSSIRTTRCYSSKSTSLIRRKCHNNNYCRLYASNSVYGDPCRGTYKYIEVKYQCTRLICNWKYY